MENTSLPRPSEQDVAVICGAKIRELRHERQLSQRALAEQILVSKSMVNRYERGRNTPTTVVLMRLASVFRVPVDTVPGYAVPNPRLVHCLQQIEQMDSEGRQIVVATLESIVGTFSTLLRRIEDVRS